MARFVLLMVCTAVTLGAFPARAQFIPEPEAFAPGFPHAMLNWEKSPVPLAKAIKCPGKTMTFSYDKEGRLVSMRTTWSSDDEEVNNSLEEWEYSPDGRLLRTVTHGSSSTDEEAAVYSSEGRLVSSLARQQEFDGEKTVWVPTALTRYTLDDKGRYIKEESCEPDGKECRFIKTYEWDDSGRVQSITFKTVGLSDNIKTFSYNKTGSLDAITSKWGSGEGSVDKTKYSYDVAGRLIKSEYGNEVYPLIINYEYNDKGAVSVMLIVEGDIPEQKCVVEY